MACILAILNLLRAPTGRAWIAIRDSEIAAQSMGVNLAGYKTLAFAVSAFLAGLAGALFAHKVGYLTPDIFSPILSIQLLMLVMVGGVGSIHGAIFGAIFLVLLPTVIALLRDYLPAGIAQQPALEPGIYGVILVLVVLLEPLGLNGLWRKIKFFFWQFPDVQECDLQAPENLYADGALAVTILQARDLAIRFGGIKAVDGITFDVAEGEIFTIIGPNGAGKTTIFNLISRIYDVSGGRLLFEGIDITRVPPHEIAGRGIARTFQNVELFEHATLLQNLLLGQHAHRQTRFWEELLFLPRVRSSERTIRRRVEEVIDFLDLQRYRDATVHDLPYGVRKIIELARALCARPKLILLDEPSSGLNVEETEDLSFWIRDIRDDLGITVVMVEHDLSLVNDVSDRVMAVNSGRLLTIGSPAAVQSHPDVVKAYLGG